jgi:hypothetical protein
MKLNSTIGDTQQLDTQWSPADFMLQAGLADYQIPVDLSNLTSLHNVVGGQTQQTENHCSSFANKAISTIQQSCAMCVHTCAIGAAAHMHKTFSCGSQL